MALPPTDPSKRRHPRKKPEPSSSALILFEDFETGAVAFIRSVVIDESVRGAGLLVDASLFSRLDTEIVVRVGDSEPRHARIAWNHSLGLSALRIGVEYVA